MQLWGGARCLAGGGSLGSQQTCQIKLVPLTIAGYQALTGDNTTRSRSQNISKYQAPCHVSFSPIVTHTHRMSGGWPWPSLMLRLGRPGPGEAAWYRERERPSSQHKTLISHVIISRECQCYASARFMILCLGHCSTVTADWCITADTHTPVT